MVDLRILCADFARVATDLGTVIISELFLSPEKRSIPAITRQVGGIGGGEKYIVYEQGMFFKFAVCIFFLLFFLS